jgi:hypothetical protein
MRQWARLILVILNFMAFGAPAQSQQFLTGEQLANLFTDTEIYHVSPKSGSEVRVIFRAGGTIGGSVGRKGKPLSGTWRISGGSLCFDIQPLNDKFCFLLARNGMELKRFNAKNNKAMPGINWKIVRPGPRAHLVLG